MATDIKIKEECDKIRDILSSGKHRKHTDICKELGMTQSTFNRRLRRIYSEDIKPNPDNILHPATNAKNKRERLSSVIEYVSNLTYEIMNDKRARAKDHLRRKLSNTMLHYY